MGLRTRIVLLLCTIVLAAACASRFPVRSTTVRPTHPVREVLPNGVTVLFEHHAGSELAAVQLWVRAGSRDEHASELGLAHYLEHMLFKGTATRPPGSVAMAVEAVGGRMNAGTSHDHTYYHATLPARHVGFAVELLADIAVNATLDEAGLEAEKQVVLEEMRQRDDAPASFLARRLYALAVRDHVYGRPVIGNADVIRGLTRDTLLRFYRRHYVPEAFVLVVVGPVLPETVMLTARRAFQSLPRSGRDRLHVAALPELARRQEVASRPANDAYLGMAWQAPPFDRADMPAVALLAAIVGQGRASRLAEELRERRGLVSSVNAGYVPLDAGGFFTVTAQLDRAHLAAAEAAVVAEIRRVRDHGVTEADHRKATTRAEAAHEFARETADGRAYRLGRAESVRRLEAELAALDRLRSVTAAQIRDAARRYLDPERYVRLAVVPDRPARALSR